MSQQTTLITKEDDERNNIVGGIDVNRLRSIIERIERLEEEKKALHQIFVIFMQKPKEWDLIPKLFVKLLNSEK